MNDIIILADPETWIGRDVNLFSDVQSLRACKTLFQTVNGKTPFGLPMPPGIFQRIAGTEYVDM